MEKGNNHIWLFSLTWRMRIVRQSNTLYLEQGLMLETSNIVASIFYVAAHYINLAYHAKTGDVWVFIQEKVLGIPSKRGVYHLRQVWSIILQTLHTSAEFHACTRPLWQRGIPRTSTLIEHLVLSPLFLPFVLHHSVIYKINVSALVCFKFGFTYRIAPNFRGA